MIYIGYRMILDIILLRYGFITNGREPSPILEWGEKGLGQEGGKHQEEKFWLLQEAWPLAATEGSAGLVWKHCLKSFPPAMRKEEECISIPSSLLPSVKEPPPPRTAESPQWAGTCLRRRYEIAVSLPEVEASLPLHGLNWGDQCRMETVPPVQELLRILQWARRA